MWEGAYKAKGGLEGLQGPGGEDELVGGSTEGPAPAARAHQRARGPVNVTSMTLSLIHI